jgi:uncharacterized protein with PIN domain
MITVKCNGCGYGVLLTITGEMSFRRCPVCNNTIRHNKKGDVIQGVDEE